MSGTTPPQPFRAINLRQAASFCRAYAERFKAKGHRYQDVVDGLERDALKYEAQALETEREYRDD